MWHTAPFKILDNCICVEADADNFYAKIALGDGSRGAADQEIRTVNPQNSFVQVGQNTWQSVHSNLGAPPPAILATKTGGIYEITGHEWN